MSRTRTKICGITRVEDVYAASALGADALGFVFHPPSPRAVDVDRAAELVAATPAFVSAVGLFVDPAEDEVRAVLDRVPLDVLQFHGDESPAFCASFGRPWIKALRMRDELDPVAECARYAGARGILLDTFVAGRAGGTGQTFDWRRVPAALAGRVILAGGLDPGNVAQAIAAVRPWAVDVSGGVEERDEQGRPRPGIKSGAAMAAFMRGVASVQTD